MADLEACRLPVATNLAVDEATWEGDHLLLRFWYPPNATVWASCGVS